MCPKNSEVQEELKCAHSSIRQHQETIMDLKESISEKESQLLEAQAALKETAEVEQKVRYSLVKQISSIFYRLQFERFQ